MLHLRLLCRRFPFFLKVFFLSLFLSFHSLFSATGEIESTILQKLHKILRPFLLRRLKVDVVQDLPPKKETILYVGLSDMQRTLYKQIFTKDMDALNGRSKEHSRLMNMMMQVRGEMQCWELSSVHDADGDAVGLLFVC